MNIIVFVLLLAALACFLLAAFKATRPDIAWTDLGRAFLVGAVLVQFGPPV